MRRQGHIISKRLLASALCAAAVAVGAYAQASAPAAPAPQAEATAPAEAAPAVSLDDCLTASLAGAPALKTAKLDLDTASAQLDYATGSNGLTVGESAGYFYQWPLGTTPTLSSSASGANGSNVKAGLSLAGPETSLGLSVEPQFPTTGGVSPALSASGSQVVYDGYPGGRPSGLVKQARYASQIARVAYDAALESLAFQVKQAYYTLLGDQNSVIARQATVRQAEEQLSQMEGYQQAGRATTLDVLQFQVALTQAQLDLRTARNTIETDRKKLSLAVGWPMEKAYSVRDAPIPELPDLDPQRALESAYANRPELRTLDFNLAAAGIDLSLQESQYSPTLSVNGALGFAQDSTPGAASGGSVSLGATIALPPIYDGKQQASLRRQKANAVDGYRVQNDQERQSISIDVQSALFSVVDGRDRLDLAGKSLEEAQGVYALQQAKFRAGLASSVDVMTAFSALAAAQVGLESAKATYDLAILNLYNAMGR